MKIKKFFIQIAFLLMLTSIIFSCVKKNMEEDTDIKSNNEIFYYYSFDEKMFLQQLEDKIFLKFSDDANKEQIHNLINRDVSLQIIDGAFCDEGIKRFAALESKNNKRIPLATLESFKKSQEIISVLYLFESENAFLIGLTDEFIVKLKENTIFAQLEELAISYNCKIGVEDEFVKNQFLLSVSKTSDFDAMQMSRMFYETDLFEFAVPNLVILNAFL